MESRTALRQRVATIGRLSSGDQFTIRTYLLRLSERDRQMRFCRGLSDAATAADFARDRGIDCVVAQCLFANCQMRALLGAVGAVCHIGDGEVVGELKLVAHSAR